MNMGSPKSIKNTAVLPVLKKYAEATWKYPGSFILVFGSLALIQVSEVMGPLFLKKFIDVVSKSTPNDILQSSTYLPLVGYALALLTSWFLFRVQMIANTKMVAKVMRDLTNRGFAYLIHHSHDFFISNFAGTLTRRVSRYARSYEQVYDVADYFFTTGLFSVGVISVLFYRNVWLGTALLLWTLFFLILQVFMTKWRYQYKLARSAEDSRLTGALSDAIGNHTAITFFAAEAHEKNLISSVVTGWYKATMQSWNADVLNYAIQGFIVRLAQVALLFLGLVLWTKGYLSVGDFILIQIYMLTLMERIGGLGSNMRRLYDAVADANEMIDILEQPHEIADTTGATNLAVTTGEIKINNITFTFSDSRPILQDFSMTIRGGEKVAFVGPSGAGKSTITKLILRLHEVTKGEISIDGQNIASVTQQSLRRSIGFVPQESVLFHRTLKENILYGNPEASEEEMVRAAKKAHAHEFISRLPLGYDTLVGERGVKLSGGERQRVAIARAILKNAPILVLDEATASLDSESEHFIQDALDTLMESKTVIVIAHRLSTIMKMDRIVVMEYGKIAAQGTHDQLLKQGGLYAKLWNIQAGGFLADQEEEV
jgi:ATP-binding cassette subfamily B protein